MKPKSTAALLLLLLFALSGCVKDPPKPPETSAPETSAPETTAPAATETDAPGTEPPETDAPETSAPEADLSCYGYTNPPQLLPFRVAEGSILHLYSLRAEATSYYAVPQTDGKVLLVLNDYIREDDGRATPVNVRVQLLDPENGAVSTELPLTGGDAPHSVSYTDGGCILFDTVWDGETALTASAWKVVTENAWSAAETSFDPSAVTDARFVSPGGDWVVEQTSLGGAYTLTAAKKDGASLKIAQDHMPAEPSEETISEARGCRGVGFLDENRFVYNIIGWEWKIGYGIVDLATGERVEFENGCSVNMISDGKLYGTPSGYAPTALLLLGEDGSKTVLADAEHIPDGAPAGVLEALFSGSADYGLGGGLVWITLYGEDGAPTDTYFLDMALTGVLAHIEFTQSVSTCRVFVVPGAATVLWK